jgi:hypothetical protein
MPVANSSQCFEQRLRLFEIGYGLVVASKILEIQDR